MRTDHRSLALLLLAGCGRLGFVPLPAADDDAGMSDTRGRDGASVTCSAWGTPSVVPVNSIYSDWGPAISPSGDRLVFESSRKNSGGSGEIYQAPRNGTTFGPETEITILSSGAFDTNPSFNAAGDELYFTSNRNAGNNRLYSSKIVSGAFQPPALVPGLTTVWAEASALSTDGLELFYDDAVGAANASIWRATRPDLAAPWVVDSIQPVTSPENVVGFPTLSADSLTMYYEAGKTTPQLYESHRASTSDPFSGGTLITELTGTFVGLGDPDVSKDGQTLFFSAAPTVATDYDIYVATRTCP